MADINHRCGPAIWRSIEYKLRYKKRTSLVLRCEMSWPQNPYNTYDRCSGVNLLAFHILRCELRMLGGWLEALTTHPQYLDFLYSSIQFNVIQNALDLCHQHAYSRYRENLCISMEYVLSSCWSCDGLQFLKAEIPRYYYTNNTDWDRDFVVYGYGFF